MVKTSRINVIILKNQIGQVKFFLCNVKTFLKNPFFTVKDMHLIEYQSKNRY
jgi:hypothetical protein